MPKFIDLSGQKFGYLTVLKRYEKDYISPKGYHIIQWECQCQCGNKTIVTRTNLKNNSTTSCGLCELNHNNQFQDLTGKRFGKLIVIKKSDIIKNNKICWECKCDCGNFCVVRGCDLKSGKTTSCQCQKSSRGEEQIAFLLTENNISFEMQKKFEDCKNINKLSFDFYVNNQYLIEFDGIQHFKETTGWNTLERFEEQQKRDEIKNKYCLDNNIPLIRIPYYHLSNLKIEDLLLETSNFIYKGDI